MLRPVTDGHVDGEEDVEDDDREDEEVYGGIEACMVLEALGLGHRCPFRRRG